MSRFFPAVLPGVILFAVACGGGDDGEFRVVVSDSAGVTIVENQGPDREAPWLAVEIARLIAPDDALTAVPWGVAADPSTGRIYVVDATEPRAVVFDRDGQYLTTLGREGQGPGEFASPAAASVNPFGALTVWDAGRGVLSRWSSEGELLNEQRAPVAYWGPSFHEHSRGLITVTVSQDGGQMEQMLIEIVDGVSRTLHSLSRELVMLELPCISQPASRIFAPMLVWTGHGDDIYVSKGQGYRIDVRSTAGVRRSVRRDLGPVQVTPEMAAERAEAGEYVGLMRLCDLTAEEVVRAVGFEEEVPPVQWISVSPDGRMWVSRSLDGREPTRVDMFGPTGEYEGTLEASGMPVAWVSSSRFVGVGVELDTGERILTLQEVTEREAGRTAAVAGVELHPDAREFQECPECPVMIEVPLGRFTMGASMNELEDSRAGRPAWTVEAEQPQVEVDLDRRFAIGKFPVTFAEWDACVDAGGCSHVPDDRGWGRGSRPVIHVSRGDAKEYLQWIGEVTGEQYRLPSEAEWEYAARAATTTARWWGDDLGVGHAVCDGCGTEWDGRSTAPVGSLYPNGFGLHDTLGNVSEWVSDCWHDDHVGAPADGSPRVETSPWWNGETCDRPVFRGGAWSYFPWTVRAARRGYYWEWPGAPWTDRDSASRGFRVARDVDHAD